MFEAVQALVNIGEDVHVVVPSDGPLVQKLRDAKVAIHFLATPWWVKEFRGHSNIAKRLFEYVKAVLKLTGFLKKLRPDIVITNTIVIPCGAFASRLVGIPHVWYIREFLEEDHGWRFEFGRQFSVLCINALSLRVIANSEIIRRRYSDRILPTKISVVYNAVNVEKECALDIPIEKQDGIFYVALVGRKSRGKGQKDAIDAIEILLKAQQKVHLWLIGDEFANYTEELKAYVNSLGLDDAIAFIPFVESPAKFMMASDVVLVCSRCEAFGRVAVEAMKLGKVVIGSNSGSMPELIRDGWNGLLYDSPDPNSLAEKILMLLENRNLRKEIETNACQWANEKFTLKIYSTNLINIIKEVTRKAIS